MLRKPTQPRFSGELPYLRLFDAAREPLLLIHTPAATVIDANPAAARLLGAPRRQLGGQDLLQLFAPESAARLRTALSVARGQGRTTLAGLRAASRAGVLGASLVDLQATPGAPATLVRLITPRARRPSRSATSTVLATLEAAAAGFVVTRGDGRVQYANPAFRRMVGVAESQDLSGMAISQWLQLCPEDRAQLEREMRNRGAVSRLVTRLRDALGRSRAVEVQAVAVPGRPRVYWGYVLSEISAIAALN